MKLEQSFEVEAPLERVWKTLIDVEHVAPCLPGAEVTGRNDDGSDNGTFTVKIGPTTASYAGKLEMEEVDESAHRAVMQANGSDKRGQGGAKATIISTLSEAQGGGTLFWSFWKAPDKERVELTKQRDVIYIHTGDKGYEVTYKGTRAEAEESLTVLHLEREPNEIREGEDRQASD